MSNVTNAILTHRHEPMAIEELQGAIEARGIKSGRFVQVDQHAVSNKSMEITVHLAAFNHLNEPALIEAIRSVRWVDPGRVQLFLKRQDDNRVTEVDLFGQFEPNRQRKMAIGKGMGLYGPPDQCAFHERFPTLMAEFHKSMEPVLRNPLREQPWRRQILEVKTQSSWVFEILAIHPEWFGQSSMNDGRLPEQHSVLGMVLAYRGVAATFSCDKARIGAGEYKRIRTTMEALDVGDAIAFRGTVCVREDGMWQLERVEGLVKVG